MAEGLFRLRVRFHKHGRLGYLSHLEVMRAQERAVRRARLPFAVTAGFSPHMKIAFGPALGVGTAGHEEYFDLWLRTYIDSNDAIARLQAAGVPDLMPDAASYINERTPSLTASLNVASYRISCSYDPSISLDIFAEALQAVVGRGVIEVQRRKPSKKSVQTKTLDLSRLLYRNPSLVNAGHGQCEIDLWTRLDNTGSLRPEVFVAEIVKLAGQDLTIVSLERCGLFHEEDSNLIRPLD